MRSLIGSLIDRAPVPYVPRRGGGLLGLGAPAADMTRSLNSMGSVGTLFSIVSRLSQATASAQWHLYRTPVDGRRVTATTPRARVEVTKHPALQVWNRPNPFMSQQLFVETFSQHLELVGEGYWLPAQDDVFNFPVELWPVRPDRMLEVPDPNDFLTGWLYRSPDGARIPLTVDEVIQLKTPNPTNPYRGMGAVQSILTDLDSTRYGAEWNRNFFINGAMPGGIVEAPNSLTDDEFNDFRDRWRQSHQGVGNAHKVAMLENGMKWVERGFSQKDMQFTELREVSRVVIREAFGISKTMLGQSEDVNRATAEAAEYVFGRWLVTNRLDRIRGALNESFLPLFGPLGEGVEFDYDSPVPADLDREAAERTSKVDAAVALVGAGWAADEVLENLGLPPMKHTPPRREPPSAPPITPGSSPDPGPAGE